MNRIMAKVLITGGKMEGKTGMVEEWVDGLHYQTVTFGIFVHRNITKDWIKVIKRIHKTDDQELFSRWFPECENLFNHFRIGKIELQTLPIEDVDGVRTFYFEKEGE